jgi:monovalent cation/hydrogen antiporter
VALALPFTTEGGGAFPKRNLIVFLTFAVIFFTLVGQGLSLPTLIRRLGLSDGGADAEEEVRARLVATKAALAEIDALASEDWTREETVQRMRSEGKLSNEVMNRILHELDLEESRLEI